MRPPISLNWLRLLNEAEMEEHDNWAAFVATGPKDILSESTKRKLDLLLGEDDSWLLDLWRQEILEHNPESYEAVFAYFYNIRRVRVR